MKVVETPLAGVLVFETDRFSDERGWFMETWNADRYRAAGLEAGFVQHNVSWSRRGVLRGLHYQCPREQGKLISVLAGAVFDVAVDLRVGSPDFALWYGCELSADNRRQLWIPPGFAHGFLVLSDDALVAYDCTVAYDAASDRAVLWNDPAIGIDWPATPLAISQKDCHAPVLAQLPQAALPQYFRRMAAPVPDPA